MPAALPPFVDARGVPVSLPAPPRRIVSLVPSTTETLFELGVGDRVVGVTRFCVHPRDALAGRVRVGGTKDLELDRLAALDPDLIVANAEENSREMFAAIEGRWPLWVAFPRSVDEAVADLCTLGALVGEPARGAALAGAVTAARHALPKAARWTYVYLIWRKPWFVASADTFITAMLAEVGGHNLISAESGRYPELTLDALRALDADRVLLSSEPFPFAERHVEELVEAGFSREKLRLVDGEACSWHGARMARSLAELAALGDTSRPYDG